jgi:class 3 adenylate cyclase
MLGAGAWTWLGLPRGPALEPGVLGALEANNLVQFGLFSVLAMNWFVEQRELAERATRAERARSERLLLKSMPRAVLDRLRADERVADRIDEASVLFADVVGFTPLAGAMDPSTLLALLDALFGSFDQVIERHGVERVKTLGDAVMVVSGAPTPQPDHARAMARCALDLRDLLASGNFQGVSLRIRIGVHSGPLVAGVLGRRRLAWDLWGDTVNVASRMESSGVAGAVHISDAFRVRLGDDAIVEDRGEIDVKGKGRMRTWLLLGLRQPPGRDP